MEACYLPVCSQARVLPTCFWPPTGPIPDSSRSSVSCPELKTRLLLLFWAVLLVMLVACANIANLLLARSAARQNEMAIRTAIGASRAQLVRQLLLESLMLSLVGGIVGFAGAAWAVHLINQTLTAGVLPIPRVELDATVLWFALGLTMLTGLVFGIVPAWRTARTDINS